MLINEFIFINLHSLDFSYKFLIDKVKNKASISTVLYWENNIPIIYNNLIPTFISGILIAMYMQGRD